MVLLLAISLLAQDSMLIGRMIGPLPMPPVADAVKDRNGADVNDFKEFAVVAPVIQGASGRASMLGGAAAGAAPAAAASALAVPVDAKAAFHASHSAAE